MSERTKLDGAIDDAIEQLIDDDTQAFYLVTASSGDGKTNFVQSWYDGTEKVPISEDTSVYKNTLMLAIHMESHIQKLKDEHDDVTAVDAFLSIATVLEEWDLSQTNVYELLGDYE